MSASVVRVLRDARELIASGAWGKGAYRQTINGRVCFCAQGALAHVSCGFEISGTAPNDWGAEATSYCISRNIITQIVKARSLVDWNDAPGRTHAEVLAAFDAAIAKAEVQS